MKIKYGAIVVAGSGKIGGHVASKNRGGAYLRTKVTPLNPNTSAQAGARSLLASLSTSWGGLSESQRKGWNNAVKDYATTDIFGDIKNPSGINLFVKLNSNLANTGQSFINDAPAKVEVPFSKIVTATYVEGSTDDSFITLEDNALNLVNVIVSATPAVSAGTSFVKNLYRVILPNVVSGNIIAYAPEYNAKFGELVAGQKFFIKFEPVMANGQKGIAQSIEVIAT